ncbi:hypothetical protein P691DRAFT_807146 [Macrolepiota fuliginosa MF-IS2]|uniref:Uncharacterized protein n=1 Tax=Macrolepiota fuliginosa MF-IS2 TaxID=1400762 RepID=A0A9P5X5T1_9AGAR|nr:hypothetical protein P691DRAFT_807146 [Macrolepiota fuliginosa MF-IS2]
MVSSALTNANAPSTREALLKNYKDAINRALSSIRTQVTEENCDIPALQAVLQKALIDFVKGLGKNSEKAKSCVRDIEQVRRLIKRDILDDEESRLAFLQRAEEALDDAEEFIRDRVHLGTANFLDRLAAFRESDIKEAKIVIKRKVAELENQQKLLGAGTDASKLIDAQGAGDALAGAVPGEQYSSVVSFLVRLGITAGKNKGQDGVDERILGEQTYSF